MVEHSVVETVVATNNLRLQVRQAALSGDTKKLSELGFPKPIHGAMEIWAASTPDIVGSYYHPEKPKIAYAAVACLRLADSLSQLGGIGIDLKARSIAYDTVEIPPYAKFPLRLVIKGERTQVIGPDVDIFGISTAHFGDQLDKPAMQQKLDKLEKKRNILVGGIVSAFGLNEQDQKRQLVRNVSGRLGELTQMLFSVIHGLDGKAPVDEFLALSHWGVIKRIMEVPYSIINLEKMHGIETSIFSQDEQYLATVSRGLSWIFEKYGPEIMKKVVDPGSGQMLSRVHYEGDKMNLSVDNSGSFVVVDDKNKQTEVGSDEAALLVSQGLPYSRLENLLLYCMGTTYHYGSEYGERNRALAVLGHRDSALKLCSAMQLGSDKTQGADLMDGLTSYLAYVLLGGEELKEIFVSATRGKLTKLNSINELRGLVYSANGI